MCASCERVRPLITRGLCDSCRHRYEDDGTITDWGYVKADRVQDYAWLRRSGETLAVAASRVGVSERTAWRYEAELATSGRVSWHENARCAARSPPSWPRPTTAPTAIIPVDGHGGRTGRADVNETAAERG